MLKVFILVSEKTSVFLPSFASLNANFSSEGVLSCSASENKQKSCTHESFCRFRKQLSISNCFPFFKGVCNLLPPHEMEGNARL